MMTIHSLQTQETCIISNSSLFIQVAKIASQSLATEVNLCKHFSYDAGQRASFKKEEMVLLSLLECIYYRNLKTTRATPGC
jgi:hypothetical protein